MSEISNINTTKPYKPIMTTIINNYEYIDESTFGIIHQVDGETTVRRTNRTYVETQVPIQNFSTRANIIMFVKTAPLMTNIQKLPKITDFERQKMLTYLDEHLKSLQTKKSNLSKYFMERIKKVTTHFGGFDVEPDSFLKFDIYAEYKYHTYATVEEAVDMVKVYCKLAAITYELEEIATLFAKKKIQCIFESQSLDKRSIDQLIKFLQLKKKGMEIAGTLDDSTAFDIDSQIFKLDEQYFEYEKELEEQQKELQKEEIELMNARKKQMYQTVLDRVKTIRQGEMDLYTKLDMIPF